MSTPSSINFSYMSDKKYYWPSNITGPILDLLVD